MQAATRRIHVHGPILSISSVVRRVAPPLRPLGLGEYDPRLRGRSPLATRDLPWPLGTSHRRWITATTQQEGADLLVHIGALTCSG
jgi:hypothetical protein